MAKKTFEEKEKLTEDDVNEKLRSLSSTLQQEYLENLLKRFVLDQNIKILASKRLADLYARKGLWLNAARIMESAADSSPIFKERKDLYMKTGILYLKALNYLLATDSFKKALEAASPLEKAKLQEEINDLYLVEAEELDKKGKMAKAVQIYERILRTNPDAQKKRKISERLMVLYEKLGKIKDSLEMRDSLK